MQYISIHKNGLEAYIKSHILNIARSVFNWGIIYSYQITHIIKINLV